MAHPLLLRLDVAQPLRGSWVVALIEEIIAERGWQVDEGGGHRPSAHASVRPLGAAPDPGDEPLLLVAVEEGTSRSPSVDESAPHLLPRVELVVGGFKARRNQRVTRAAIERFLVRVEQERPVPVDPSDGPDGAEAAAGPAASSVVAQHQALLAEVDAWLARTSLTPDAAQAVHADQAILAAALTAPEIDLVIVERAASRLAARVA